MPAILKRLENSARARIAGRILISALAIAIDVQFVPGLYVARTFYALAAFALLVLVTPVPSSRGDSLPKLTVTRMALFVGLHVLLIALASKFAITLDSAKATYTVSASLFSLAKILIIVPALVLFWTPAFIQRYRSEFVAALFVLLTFFPDRLIHSIWPWYSRLLTTGLAIIGGAFVPGTVLAETATMFTVTGPSVIMLVDFSCSGITGIDLFQILFALVVLVEWNRIDKRRATICYILGLFTYVAANFLRLVLLYIIGNRISHHPDLDSLGWVLFVLTFVVIMKASYAWIVRLKRPSPAISLAKAETA